MNVSAFTGLKITENLKVDIEGNFLANLIRLTPIRQFRRRAVGNCSALGNISKRDVMRFLGEWIFFNVLNFDE